MALRNGTDRALGLIRTLPRVALNNLRPLYPKKRRAWRGQHGGGTHGFPKKGAKHHQSYCRLGYEKFDLPFYLSIPVEQSYYKGHHVRRQYPPLSLLNLQTLIDTKRISADEPIDLATICNTKIYNFNPAFRHFGFQLTDEGLDGFKAKVNIEVQWTTEPVIAAVEKNGGVITTAYYDQESLWAIRDPETFFKRGVPIMKRMLPPADAIEYYTDPKFRGYLADPDEIARERFVLSQKYGYQLPDINIDPKKEMLLRRKDPKQVFFGLNPGWVVSLRDRCILKPKDPLLLKYYNDETIDRETSDD